MRSSRKPPIFHLLDTMKYPISISFSVSDSYVQHLAVVIASFVKSNPESDFVFHVLHHDITDSHQRMLTAWNGGRAGCRIIFHKIDESLFAAFPIPPELEHVTREMYYRYILADVLQEEKRTIYSDVDVICVGDISSLWNLDLQGNILAAVSEGASGEFKKRLIGLEGEKPYFNSGLLVMDLEQIRSGNYITKLFDNTRRYAGKIAWPDQDVINITFRGKILQLSSEWNGINVKYSPFRKDIIIWHFPGATMKPWCNIWKNRTWPMYLKYLLITPFRGNAWRFVGGHIKGFFWYSYTKKQIRRTLCCGILVWKKRIVK